MFMLRGFLFQGNMHTGKKIDLHGGQRIWDSAHQILQQQVTIDNYWDNVCVWFEYVHTRRRAVIEVTAFLGLKRLKSKILIIDKQNFNLHISMNLYY